MAYVKFRFVGRNGATAGLVITRKRYETASIGELSHLFPFSEAPKMDRLEVSPAYPDQAAALAHEFADRN